MMGLAASPGTDVEPICSIPRARSPRALRMRVASCPKASGQVGLYTTKVIGPLTGLGSPTVTFRAGVGHGCSSLRTHGKDTAGGDDRPPSLGDMLA